MYRLLPLTHWARRARAIPAFVSAFVLLAAGFAPIAPALAAAPSITYAATTTTPLSMLTVSGSGFSPAEKVLLSFGLSSATATADGSGSFSGAQIAIPNVPAGLYYLIAVGQTSGLVAFSAIYVNSFFPVAAPSGWYVSPGQTVTWSGSGFLPGETVTVADAHRTTIATFAADSGGAFSLQGATTIPLTARNSAVAYTVKGQSTGAIIPISITVSDLYPNVTPSLWYALPGTTIGAVGTGFGPGEGVDVFLGSSTAPLAHATADSTGSVSFPSLTLPFGSASAQFRFVGAITGAVARAPITLASYYPQLTPSAWYASPGSALTLSGSGFAPNEPVALTVGGSAVATTTADATGLVAPQSISMPTTPNSTAHIQAVGTLSGATAAVGITIGQYYPGVTPNAWYAYPGDTISFSGSGFAPHETVTMSGAMSGTVTTDGQGSWSGFSAKIPVSASGSAAVTFTGATSGASETITITLGVRTSAIWFDNYYAQGGTPLTVFGAGFGIGENVALSANGAVFATTTTDTSGSFAAHTAMPFSAAGPLTITATGSDTGAAAGAALTVAPVYTDFELGSYAVSAGSPLALIGHGYLPSDPITVTNDRSGSTTVASFTADAGGNFNDSSFILPDTWTSGPLTVVAHGAHSLTDSSITLWVIGK